jgi:hypothetical protein
VLKQKQMIWLQFKTKNFLKQIMVKKSVAFFGVKQQKFWKAANWGGWVMGFG